jgi:alpha-L-arabinofuranosidase
VRSRLLRVKFFAFTFLVLFGITLGVRAQDLVIYDDALENGWQSYGWATLNYANTSPVQSGSDSISVIDPGSSAEALYLHHAAFDPSFYQSLSFWIYPTTAQTNEFQVQATLTGAPQTAVMLSFTAAQVNQWQQVTIPLASLGVAGKANFDGFWIQNNTGGPLTWYIDTISLPAVPPPNPAPLTVNAQSVVRTVDARTSGVNLAIWDSYLNTTATGPLLTAMGTGAVRFPGGSASDDYDWSTDRSALNGTFQWANNAATFASVTAAAGAQAYVT